MKLFNFLFLLALAQGICAQSVLPPNKAFTYDYNSTIISGIKGFSQFSVFTVQSKLKVFTLPNPYVYFMLEDVKIGEKNEELPEVNLKTITIRTERNAAFEEALKEPFGAKFENGMLKEVYFEEGREDGWTKDLKKGIIDLFQMPRDQSRERMGNDLPVPGQFEPSRSFKSREVGIICDWNSQSNGFDSNILYVYVIGKCDVQTTQESLPYPGNSQTRTLNITKRHNLKWCNSTPEFVLSNLPAMKCKECKAERAHVVQHNIITQLGIEERERNWVIEKLYREGAVKVSLMGAQGDTLLSYYNQWAVMKGMESRNSQGRMLQKTQEESPISDLQLRMQAAYFPGTQRANNEILTNITTGLRRLLDEMAELTENKGQTENVKKILSNEILIQKAFSSLPQTLLQKVVEENLQANSPKDQIKRKAVLDMLPKTGTKDAVQVIMKLIQENKISSEQRIVSLLRNIPAHVLFPDLQMAEMLLDLCSKERKIMESSKLQKNCYFSFASMVSRTCTKFNSTHTLRPVPSEKRCPQTQLKSFVSHVKRAMEEHREHEHEEMEAAMATVLGLMNARESVFALESRVKGQGTDSPLVQMASIYASRFLAMTFPEEVRHIMFSVLYDSLERSEVRIAAVSVIMATVPPPERIEELAQYTQIVKDQQVGAFIISALKAISKITLPCLRNMAKNANYSLGLANMNAEDSVFMGYAAVVDNMMSFLQAGYGRFMTLTGDSGSYIPSDLRMDLRNFASGFMNSIYEFNAHGNGLRAVFDKLLGPGNMYSRDTMADILANLNRPLPNVGLDGLGEKLGIRQRFDEMPRILVGLRMLHHKFTQGYLNATEVTRILLKVLEKKDSIQSSGNFDFLRYMMPFDFKYVIPSAAGHHLHLDIKLPMMVAFRGSYSVRASGRREDEEGNANVQVNIEPMLAAKLNVKFGPVLPFRQSTDGGEMRNRVPLGPTWGAHYSGGFETTVIIKPQMSGIFEGNFDRRNRNFRLSLTPTQSGSGRRSNDVIYYETKPFTAVYSRPSLGSLADFAKPMRMKQTPFKVNYPISITSSSDITIKGTHEDEWLDQANIISAISQRKFGGIFNFPFLTQRLRMRRFEIEMSPKSSQSKYMMNINWDFTPAESDPRPQPKNLRQALWSALSGWFSVPQECIDVRPEFKPWERQESKMFMMPKSHHYRTSTDRPSYSSFFGFSSEESSEERRSKSSQQSSEGFSDELRSKENPWDLPRKPDLSKCMYRGAGQPLSVQAARLGKGSPNVRLSVTLEVKGGKDITYVFNSTMRAEHEKMIKQLDAVFVKKGSEGTFNATVMAILLEPRRSCFFGGPTISDENNKMKIGSVLVQWGRQQDSQPNSFEAIVGAEKSPDQLQLNALPSNNKLKPWFYAKCEQERQKGFLNHEACQMAMDHMSQFQRVEVDLDFSKAHLPASMQKVMVKAKKLLMHKFFNHMSEDLEKLTNPGKAVIELNFNYSMPVLNAILTTSQERTMFKNIFFGNALPGLSPPSSRKSMIQMFKKTAEYVTNHQAPSACLASGRYLKSFDNVTLDLRGAGDCPHLITKDCSAGNAFYVLLKRNDRSKYNDKTLIVGALKHVITVVPREQESKQDILINGEPKPTENRMIQYLRDPSMDNNLVAMIVKTSPIYNVILPYLGIRVKFDGNNVKVQASHLWRGKLCGLCGEFQGRKQYNRIGPDYCAYPTDNDLVSQYVVRNGSCNAVQKSSGKLCGVRGWDRDNMKPKMEGDASFDLEKMMGRPHQMKTDEVSRDMNCLVMRRLTSRVGPITCISVDPQTQCDKGCEATDFEERLISAYCLRNDDRRLHEVQRQGDQADVQKILKMRPNGKMSIKVDNACTQNV